MKKNQAVVKLINQGANHFLNERLIEAERIFLRASKLAPQSNLVHFDLGLVYQKLNQIKKAIFHFRKAVKIQPADFEANNNLGNLLLCQNKIKEAIPVFARAVKTNPGFAEGFYNLGVALQMNNQLNPAIINYRKSLSLKADNLNALNNLAVALNKTGKTDESIQAFEKALAVNPKTSLALTNLGALLIYRDSAQAQKYLERAVAADPYLVEAHYNLGVALQSRGLSIDAIECFKKVLSLNPDYAPAYGQLYHKLRQICDWEEVKKITPKLDSLKNAETPFVSVTRKADPRENWQIAKAWSENIADRVSNYQKVFYFTGRQKKRGKIRLGYLSNDFKDHPTSHLMLGQFRLHNKDKFEVFVYSYGGNDHSRYLEEIKKSADKFVDLTHTASLKAAEMIYQDKIDILIDLKGHTQNSRLEIPSLKPSPVQVHYLGFPGTLGADFFDYFIADPTVLPKNQLKYYSEKVIYLPDCYQVNDNQQPISQKNFTRADFCLPPRSRQGEGVVFCSFNQPYKIEPEVFRVWMKILKTVPGSVLWLWWKNRLAEINLGETAEKAGVSVNRLIFSPSLPKAEHLKRLQLADLALDTFTCNGHTSTADALWADVPVVTLQGKHFASRVSSSLLTNIGLTELITHNKKQYIDLSVKLAQDPEKLKKLKKKLAQNRLSKPLFNTSLSTKNLEAAYEKMWQEYSKAKRNKLPVIEININQDASPAKRWPDNSLVFFCGPQDTPWDPQGLSQPEETFLGGSEESMVYLTQELKKLGWNITVYSQPKRGKNYQGIKWRNYSLFKPQDFFNILIFWRRVELVDLDCRAKSTYLWCQDILDRVNFTPQRLKKLNKIIVLSQAHRSNLAKVPNSKFLVSANGYLEHSPKTKPQNHPHWCLWTSSYDRGLEHILEIWPEVIKQVPDAQLHIFYGWQLLDQFCAGDPVQTAWKAKIVRLFNQPGVTHHGRAPQTEMENWYKKCGLFTYPSHFFETSCISAIKAQAYGAVPITTTTGALNETVQYGIKIPGDIKNPKVLKKYQTVLIKALKDPEWQEEQRKKMIPWAKKRYSWTQIAKQWSKEFKI